ncbi:unnamed protein product [Withania somnifera]
MMGMVLYSYYCTREGQKKATEAFVQLQTKEGESDPLIGMENGAGATNDVALPISPIGKADSDLRVRDYNR